MCLRSAKRVLTILLLRRFRWAVPVATLESMIRAPTPTTPINTCFGTHHLMFAEDADNTLWTSGGGTAVGWLNTREFLETGDAVAAQGWTPFILDTNGNGRRDDYVEPDANIDPSLDKRINSGLYAVAPAPDGSMWGSNLSYPGAVVRVMPGADPSYHGID